MATLFAKSMRSSPATLRRSPAIGKLIAAALIGGVVAGAVAYLFAFALPWLFRTTGIFPYAVPESLLNELTHVATGSVVIAVPIALMLGVPILYVAFRWTPRPVAVAAVLGGSVGPILLGLLLGRTETWPYGSTAVLSFVAFLGVLGVRVSAWFISFKRGAGGKQSAA